jgi:hypothetical protein
MGAGDLPMVKAAFEKQAQHVTNFTHGQLWTCHVALDNASSAPRLTSVATSCGYYPVSREMACPACREITVRLGVKYAGIHTICRTPFFRCQAYSFVRSLLV